MKKIGFVGCADTTTLIGDVVDAPDAGLDTVNGKSVDGCGGGACACGAGSGLEDGDQVIATGGVEG